MDRAAAQSWVDDFLTEGAPTSAAKRAQPPGADFEPRFEADPDLGEMAAPPLPDAAAPEAAAPDEPDPFARPFSPFVPSDVERSADIVGALREASQGAASEADALAAVRGELENMAAVEAPGVVQHALKVFIAHDARGRTLNVPALETRAPLKAVQTFDTLEELSTAAAEDPEMIVAWFREDPQANEHHDHWHAVYPTGGVADPASPDPRFGRIQDRQGELFIYMHEQMLARYDTERLASPGLERVAPFDDLHGTIDEGYDPTPGIKGLPEDLWFGGTLPAARPAGAEWPAGFPLRQRPDGSIEYYTIEQILEQEERLRSAAESGQMQHDAGSPVATTPHLLGAALEPQYVPALPGRPSQGSPSMADYGWVHGVGHMLISMIPSWPPNGVMADTDTAIRDPAFWRWHKRVDNFSRVFQDALGPRRFEDEGHPDVEIRPSDLILWESPDPDDPDALEALRAYGRETFGGAHFDEDFASGPSSTDTLTTRFERRPLQIKDVALDDPPMIDYLDQRPFAYAVRVANRSDSPVELVLRVFIVAEELATEREMYIELDKFVHSLGPGERSVAVRHGSESSVIRKPAHKPPDPLRHSPPGTREAPAWDVDSYCTCGWPYNLLLPMGTDGEGMAFRMVVVATNYADDGVKGSTCGSVSYCGAQDEYPDKRPMGYPFDRPFPEAGIAATIDARAEMASRPFRIRCENQPKPAEGGG